MRGLPSCGKSTTAKRLAADQGVICETDEYFYTQVGSDSKSYDYDASLAEAAREWNYSRFCEAISRGVSPVVVDRGNGLNQETQRYARSAVQAGYAVELVEPEAPWWSEIRVLLKYKAHTGAVLDQWAEKLARMNKATHRTPRSRIRHWMAKWRDGITVEAILSFEPSQPRSQGTTAFPDSD